MARASQWRRDIGTNGFTSVDEGARRTHFRLVASSAAGETLTRSIGTVHAWLNHQPLSATETMHMSALAFGLLGTSSAFSTPPIDPFADANNEGWVWWEYMPISPVNDITFWNDDWIQHAVIKFDTSAQRIIKSGGVTPISAKWWFIVSARDNDTVGGQSQWNFNHGASLLFLLPE